MTDSGREGTAALNPRRVIEERLRKDLGQATEIDIRAATLCGEMGCREMEEFITKHPVLRCPYGRFPDGRNKCARLREEYQAAVAASSTCQETDQALA